MPINLQNRIAKYVFFMLFILLNTNAKAETITLVADAWCPFSCLATNERHGIGVDIAKDIFEAAGFTVIYKTTNWHDAIQQVASSKADVLIAASGVDSDNLLIPKVHFSYMHSCFITLHEQWQYLSNASLDDVTLGIVSEYTDGFSPLRKKSFQYSEDRHSLKTYPDTESLVKALHNKEIDVIHDNIDVAGYLSTKNNLTENHYVSGCIRSKLFLGLSPTRKGKKLEKIVNKGLLQTLKDGTIKKIHQQYGINNY